jgi:hypothetical protein
MRYILNLLIFLIPASLSAGTSNHYTYVSDEVNSWIQATWEDMPNTSNYNEAMGFFDAMVGNSNSKIIKTRPIWADCVFLGKDSFNRNMAKCIIKLNIKWVTNKGAYSIFRLRNDSELDVFTSQLKQDIYIQSGNPQSDGSGGVVMNISKDPNSAAIQIGNDLIK